MGKGWWRWTVSCGAMVLVGVMTGGSACVEPARDFVPGEPRLPYEPAGAWAAGCVNGPAAAVAVLQAEAGSQERFGAPIESLVGGEAEVEGSEEGGEGEVVADGGPASRYLVERLTIMRQRDRKEWPRVVDRFVEHVQGRSEAERAEFAQVLKARMGTMDAASGDKAASAGESDCYAMLKEHREALTFILDAPSRRAPGQ